MMFINFFPKFLKIIKFLYFYIFKILKIIKNGIKKRWGGIGIKKGLKNR